MAGRFDETFGPWKSVAAQRRAVRRALLAAFPEGSRLLELGGGTGQDALFLAERGRHVHLTDGSPAMVACAAQKAREAELDGRVTTERLSLEELDLPSTDLYDGVFSNFASLNCVEDLAPVGRGIAARLRPGGRALLVVFGPFCPLETLVLALKGRFRDSLRRLAHTPAPARVAGETFTVRYPAPPSYARAFAPGLVLRRASGIGVFVPPSSAEPFVSRVPGLVSLAEILDREASALWFFGDHVLLDFERTP
jgi:SAM-dependent methyltransferase